MGVNTAIDTKDKLKKAIKEGKTSCVQVATLIDKIINEALWEFLTIPGETAADKLHNLICLPLGEGGLNTKIDEIDALLGIRKSTQIRFRNLVFQAKPGTRTDLKSKSADKTKQPKAKKRSPQGKTVDRNAGRALDAIPKAKDLIDNDLITKTDLAKLGKPVKDKENPTESEKKVLQLQKEVTEELEKIVPEKLPVEENKKQELKDKIKNIVSAKTKKEGGTKTTRITVSDDPKKVAEAILKLGKEIEFYQDLITELQIETDKAIALEQEKNPILKAA